ncbi:MAG: inositol 2-dehydrogenase [Clostridia bacterium BRH_c25]|nr:MAG: inositol 2-dehydrogenase [Clostridia bacterium BRH_c25]
MKDRISVGILGAGRIGRLHAENIAYAMPEVNIASIADVSLNDEMKKWADGIGVTKLYSDPDMVINDKAIDAVLICSSTNTHADLIVQCARAGKDIFCEKPIDFNLDKINKALIEVEKAGVKLQVGFVRRFDHNHKKVRDVVASGSLGKPHIIKVTSRDPVPQPIEYVKVSGGLFMDMMIHDFDMARYLSGSEVTEVAAYGNVLIDESLNSIDDIDTAIVMLKFENGSIGVIDNSRRAGYGYDQRTEVHCDKGCVQVSNDVPNSSMISTAEGVFLERPLWFFLERYNNAFISEIKAFADAVKNDKETLVGSIDGLMPVKIAIAAKKSLKEGRSVKISEI